MPPRSSRPAWPARKGQLPLTILRTNRRGRHGSSLAGSINYSAPRDQLSIGSPNIAAAMMQPGGMIEMTEQARQSWRRFAKAGAEGAHEVTIKARSITIPVRPYIGGSEADRLAMTEDAEDWLSGSRITLVPKVANRARSALT